MAQTTALQFINEVEDRIGWRQSETIEGNDVSKDTRKLLRLLNRILRTAQSDMEWPLLRVESEIITIAEYKAGWVAVTNGSATVTGVANDDTVPVTPSFDQTFIGRAFQFDGDDYVYRIVSVESTTSFTINRIYLGTTSTGATYIMAQDKYSLPEDFDRPIDSFKGFFAPNSIAPVSDHDFSSIRRNRGNLLYTSDPAVFTVGELDTQLLGRVIRFDPFPEKQRMLTYRYMRNHPELSEDDDRILFPARAENMLIETMIDFIYRDYEDDDRMQRSMVDVLRSKNTLLSSPEITQTPLRITPSNARRLAERQRFGSSSRVDYGGWFDMVGFKTKG